MAEVFANNASGNLNAGITNASGSCVLQAGQGAAFPSGGTFHVIIDSEVITCSARSGDTITFSARGEFGAAASHLAGATVTAIETAQTFQSFAQGTLVGVRVFTSSGTYTPTAGTNKVYVECVGGGGGGGGAAATAAGQNSAAGAGGGGAYAASYLTSGFSGVSYAIGAAGTAGVAGNNAGGNGGDTTFNTTTIIAKGGTGGSGSPIATGATITATGGAGGSASGSTGDAKANGGQGGQGWILALGNNVAEPGGGTVLGATSSRLQNGTSAGTGGVPYGGGGGGGLAVASAAAQAGGAGAAGIIRIWEFA